MNANQLPRALSLVATLALAACGGGGSDGGAPPPADPLSGPVTTDLQAKTLAARSIDALFAYDNMNSETLGAALVPLPVTKAQGPRGAFALRVRPNIVGDDGPGGGGGGGGGPVLDNGPYPVACAAGSGTTTFSDVDANHHISAGDYSILAGTACQPSAAFPWALGGSVRVDIVGGTNVEQHLFFVSPGSAQLRVTHAGTAIGGNRSVTGVYTIAVSNSVDGAPPDQDIAVKDMTIAHPDVNLRLVGLSYKVMGSSRIAAATGRFDTSVAGIGDVQLALAVKSALTVDAATTRFRPSAGSVTLSAADFSFDVEYGAGGAVTIRVDNGRDGTVDRTVTTTVAELDSLLTTK